MQESATDSVMTLKEVLFDLLEAMGYVAVDYFCSPVIHSILSSEPSENVPLGEIGAVGVTSQTATVQLKGGETA